MIIGLKANIEAIADTYQKAYPTARILYPGKEDFTKKNRTIFFNDIKNNTYDCIILTHEQFEAIPSSPKEEELFMQEELNSLVANLKVQEESTGISKRAISGLQKRIENLKVKIADSLYKQQQRETDIVNFETLGISHIFVDEYQAFKNLEFTTRHSRVAGLNNQSGSVRARKLLLAMRAIQHRTGRDCGATFLSGTVLTNSITEMYTLFKYQRPQEMERRGMPSFDAWAAVYAQKSVEYEFTITGEIASKERYRRFIKVPELASFYSEITDYKTAEDIGLIRPKERDILCNIAPTKDQEVFIKALIEFAKTGETKNLHLKNPIADNSKARMLQATTMANKMSLDMRLINDEIYKDDEDNKLSKAAKNIADYYFKFIEQKGTQFVFSDLGTYKANEFNAYSELKRKLVEDYKIPENEIKFIHEYDTPAKKDEFSSLVSAGTIRIAIGSTSKLGTGVNAQHKVVAVHHLDIPWRPSDLKQRNGRAVRRDNIVAELYNDNNVDVHIYAVEKTLDAYKFNTLKNKQLFINQIKKANIATRRIDEGSMDEESGMNFAEYVAILSGNQDLLTKTKLEQKICGLESAQSIFYKSRREYEMSYDILNQKLDKLQNQLNALKTDNQRVQSNMQHDGKGNVIPALILLDVDGCDIKTLGEKLQVLNRTANTRGEDAVIGNIYGFDVIVRTDKMITDGTVAQINKFGVRGSNGILYTYNNGNIASDNKLAVENFVKALMKIPELIERTQTDIDVINKEIPTLQTLINTEWEKEGELKTLRVELRDLEDKIRAAIEKEKQPDPEPKKKVNDTNINQSQEPSEETPRIPYHIYNESKQNLREKFERGCLMTATPKVNLLAGNFQEALICLDWSHQYVECLKKQAPHDRIKLYRILDVTDTYVKVQTTNTEAVEGYFVYTQAFFNELSQTNIVQHTPEETERMIENHCSVLSSKDIRNLVCEYLQSDWASYMTMDRDYSQKEICCIDADKVCSKIHDMYPCDYEQYVCADTNINMDETICAEIKSGVIALIATQGTTNTKLQKLKEQFEGDGIMIKFQNGCHFIKQTQQQMSPQLQGIIQKLDCSKKTATQEQHCIQK